MLEAAAQSAPTAPPSDRLDREAHSSHHHTSCILRQVLSYSLAAASLIDGLTEARLLVKSSDERGEPLLEVAHEVLFTGWPRLAMWIADTGDDLRLL